MIKREVLVDGVLLQAGCESRLNHRAAVKHDVASHTVTAKSTNCSTRSSACSRSKLHQHLLNLLNDRCWMPRWLIQEEELGLPTSAGRWQAVLLTAAEVPATRWRMLRSTEQRVLFLEDLCRSAGEPPLRISKP